jgi:hypothetical protein
LRQPFTAKADAKKGRIVAMEGTRVGPGSAPREKSGSMRPGHQGRGRTEEIECRSEFADCGGKSWCQIGVAFDAQQCLIVTDSDMNIQGNRSVASCAVSSEVPSHGKGRRFKSSPAYHVTAVYHYGKWRVSARPFPFHGLFWLYLPVLFFGRIRIYP